MAAEAPLLEVRGLCKRYVRRRGTEAVDALRGVDLELRKGGTLALVGQSGSGKSTLARCMARLEEPSAGEVLFEGVNLLALEGRRLRPFRPRLQLVMQDSAAALDPRLTAADIVAEPLEVTRRGGRRERRRQALDLMETVGVPAAAADRRPHELSGGQRQRLALARALALQPRLLILDEAFAGLDASVQAQVAALLEDLRARHGLAYLYISHDLALVAALADEVAILFEGRIVDRGTPTRVFAEPRHAHTSALVAAAAALPPAVDGAR
jgi:ABC-type glutathione transport system ATPase component